MKTIEVTTQPVNVAALVELARKEAGLLVLHAGQPVAQILPLSKTQSERISPLHPGAIESAEDFDAPLPESFWLGKS